MHAFILCLAVLFASGPTPSQQGLPRVLWLPSRGGDLVVLVRYEPTGPNAAGTWHQTGAVSGFYRNLRSVWRSYRDPRTGHVVRYPIYWFAR